MSREPVDTQSEIPVEFVTLSLIIAVLHWTCGCTAVMSYSNRLPLTEDSCYEIVHLELTREIDHGIFDDDLAHIIPWCPNLQSVHVSGFLDLTDRTVVLLATYASKLRRLDISGCRGVTDVGVLEVASTLMGLEVLKLSGLSTLMDPAVSAITRSLPRLQELEMNDLPLITAVSVRDIWTFCRKLRRLKLAHCPQLNDRAFPYAPHSKSSPGVASIRSSAQAARDVRLSASPGRSRPPTWLDSLPPLILTPGHTLPDLRLLDLSHCSKLTDAAIAGVIAHAPRIQHLTLSGCTGLTDAAMHAVAKLGVHLDVLALTRVEKLTDAGIVALVRGCPRLKSVEVSCKHASPRILSDPLAAHPTPPHPHPNHSQPPPEGPVPPRARVPPAAAPARGGGPPPRDRRRAALPRRARGRARAAAPLAVQAPVARRGARRRAQARRARAPQRVGRACARAPRSRAVLGAGAGGACCPFPSFPPPFPKRASS